MYSKQLFFAPVPSSFAMGSHFKHIQKLIETHFSHSLFGQNFPFSLNECKNRHFRWIYFIISIINNMTTKFIVKMAAIVNKTNWLQYTYTTYIQDDFSFPFMFIDFVFRDILFFSLSLRFPFSILFLKLYLKIYLLTLF